MKDQAIQDVAVIAGKSIDKVLDYQEFYEWLKGYDDRNNPYILYSEQYWEHAKKQWMEGK